MTCAWDMASGSSCACSERTSCNVFKKVGFSVKDSGVGGSLVVTPIARSGFGGSDGNSDRRWFSLGDFSFGNTYWERVKQSAW